MHIKTNKTRERQREMGRERERDRETEKDYTRMSDRPLMIRIMPFIKTDK